MEPVIIILLSMLVLGLLAVVQMIKKRKRKSAQLALELAYESIVKKHKFKIGHIEVFDNRIIALDRDHKMLLFLYHSSTDHQEVVMPLLELVACKTVEKHNENGYIRNIYLQLVTQADDKERMLCFFDEQYDKPISLLPALRRVKNWKQRIEANRNPGTISLEAEYVL
jgi:hypothetical protein